jgi:ATP/ADP translocase
LALFTSTEYGFAQAAVAYPLANGLISPFSLILLWGYGRQLRNNGPRVALYHTTLFSILFIAASCLILQLGSSSLGIVPKVVQQGIIGLTFLFQSSYQYLLYTQQWSFVGSVLTPQEGAQWFATLAGCSSLLSSLCGAVIPYMLPYTGLLGLMATTCITLTLCLFCSDRAYSLAQQHGFDPAASNPNNKKPSADKEKKDTDQTTGTVGDTIRLFRRVPTLAALMLEVLTFQSLNTILNVAFVRATRLEIANDIVRSAYTSRFFSYINAVSATLQFLILPTFMKYTEPGAFDEEPLVVFIVVDALSYLTLKNMLILLA